MSQLLHYYRKDEVVILDKTTTIVNESDLLSAISKRDKKIVIQGDLCGIIEPYIKAQLNPRADDYAGLSPLQALYNINFPIFLWILDQLEIIFGKKSKKEVLMESKLRYYKVVDKNDCSIVLLLR